MRGPKWARVHLLLLALFFSPLSCEGPQTSNIGGETHFLRLCEPDNTQSCGEQLSCVHDACTLICNGNLACAEFPDAECIETNAGDELSPQAVCDVTCSDDSDCSNLSSAHLCRDGHCRLEESQVDKIIAKESLSCSPGEVSPNEMLIIGDSFFATTHEITAQLELQAEEAGLLDEGQSLRDASRLQANALAFAGNGIREQYAEAQADSGLRLVIMNGGGADATLGSCNPVNAECPVLAEAALAAEELFDQMAADGIKDVLYVFYPNPVDLTQKEMVDALRPSIRSACETAPLNCEWLDLRPIFEDHYNEYIIADGRNPTDEGSEIVALEIWERVEICLAP